MTYWKNHGEVIQSVSGAGFEAGWYGVKADKNPETWAGKRRTWERHRKLGEAAHQRLLMLRSLKIRGLA